MENRPEDDNLIVASRRQVFRGIEYVVKLVVNKEENQFSLEVEDRLTADQWRGQFDAKCEYYCTFRYMRNLSLEDVPK